MTADDSMLARIHLVIDRWEMTHGKRARIIYLDPAAFGEATDELRACGQLVWPPIFRGGYELRNAPSLVAGIVPEA